MNLEFISTDSCPICGCQEVVGEKVDTFAIRNGVPKICEHAHGGKWEHRDFLCGVRISYSPNGGREELSGRCKNDPLLKARDENREKVLLALKEHIAAIEVDDDFKVLLQDRIHTAKSYM